MCGIVAYIGHKEAAPILLEGLKRLEYRGYDSAGLAIMRDGALHLAKAVGRVSVLEELVNRSGTFGGTMGIAHTRWATHGGVTDRNAHPHRDDEKLGHGIAIIHNGIIENYAVLKKYLGEKATSSRARPTPRCSPTSSASSTAATSRRPCRPPSAR